MSVQHQNVTLAALSGGMDYDSRPYSIAQSKWRTVFNFRHNGGLVQVARKRPTATLSSGATVTWLGALPSDSHAVWLAATPAQLYRLEAGTGGALVETTLGSLSGTDERLATYHYNGALWLTSPSNQVHYTDGARLREVTDRRTANTKASGEDLTGDGPFTLDPLYAIDGTIVGDLGGSFTWTTGQYYRVYCTAPKRFKLGWQVVLTYLATDATDSGLAGEIVATTRDYIRVRATNTRASVRNLSTTPPAQIDVTAHDLPSARYLSVFFDHLVLGAPTYRGQVESSKVRWSHLRDFAEWDPDTSNEADSYTCTEFQRPTDLVEGVTGVEQFGDLLLIFTYSCVYVMQYTGLPPVMHVQPLLGCKDHGNGLYYATAALGDSVVWCDLGHADFFAFRGNGPESFGHGIRDWFFNDLNSDPQYAQQTWCYVDRFWHEVVWVYISNGATTHNRAVAFNYKYKEWSARSVEGLRCFATQFRSTTSVARLAGTASALAGTSGALGKQTTYLGNVWGALSGQVLVEAVSGSTVTGMLSMEQAYLETGDFLLGTLEEVKEIDQVTLSASQAMTVKLQARDAIEASVSFVTVGTWSLSMTTGNTLPFTGGGRAGRAFRFRLEPTVANEWCTFNLIEPDALNIGATR